MIWSNIDLISRLKSEAVGVGTEKKFCMFHIIPFSTWSLLFSPFFFLMSAFFHGILIDHRMCIYFCPAFFFVHIQRIFHRNECVFCMIFFFFQLVCKMFLWIFFQKVNQARVKSSMCSSCSDINTTMESKVITDMPLKGQYWTHIVLLSLSPCPFLYKNTIMMIPNWSWI